MKQENEIDIFMEYVQDVSKRMSEHNLSFSLLLFAGKDVVKECGLIRAYQSFMTPDAPLVIRASHQLIGSFLDHIEKPSEKTAESLSDMIEILTQPDIPAYGLENPRPYNMKDEFEVLFKDSIDRIHNESVRLGLNMMFYAPLIHSELGDDKYRLEMCMYANFGSIPDIEHMNSIVATIGEGQLLKLCSIATFVHRLINCQGKAPILSLMEKAMFLRLKNRLIYGG